MLINVMLIKKHAPKQARIVIQKIPKLYFHIVTGFLGGMLTQKA